MMRYYYETIRETSRSSDYAQSEHGRSRGTINPGVWHVFDVKKSRHHPIAVCHDRSDAEAIVKLFTETADHQEDVKARSAAI